MRVRVSAEGERVDIYELPENVNEFFRLALSEESSTESLATLLDRVVEPALLDESYDKVLEAEDTYLLAEARTVLKAIKDALRRRAAYPLLEDERIDFI